MDTEIKTLFEEQAKTFEQFKAANDRMQADVKKLGDADVLQKESVEKLNKGLDEIAEKIKAATKHTEELEAKFNRAGVGRGGAGGADDAEVKSAQAFGRQLGHDVTLDDFRDYKRGFDAYMRKGDKGRDPELKALSVGSDPDGGYFVTPDVSGRMVKKIYETSPIRQIASVVTIGTDALEGAIDNGEAGCGWVGETQPRTETTTPQVGKWAIPVNEVYAMPKATQKLLEDANVNLETWLEAKVADKIARTENTAFVAGDGILKPKGLLSYLFAATDDKSSRPWGTFQYVPSGGASGFAASNPGDALYDLVYSLKAGYRGNARFMMARATVGTIRKFKDGQGRYLWQPALTAGQPATIVDYPVVEGEDMPDCKTANNYAIAFGDFAETYQIVDRVGISVLRDPFTQKGWVLFYTRRRTGGGAVNFESMKFLKMATS